MTRLNMYVALALEYNLLRAFVILGNGPDDDYVMISSGSHYVRTSFGLAISRYTDFEITSII